MRVRSRGIKSDHEVLIRADLLILFRGKTPHLGANISLVNSFEPIVSSGLSRLSFSTPCFDIPTFRAN
jgi:hypothetical protein